MIGPGLVVGAKPNRRKPWTWRSKCFHTVSINSILACHPPAQISATAGLKRSLRTSLPTSLLSSLPNSGTIKQHDEAVPRCFYFH